MALVTIAGNKASFDLAIEAAQKNSSTAMAIWEYLKTGDRGFDVIVLDNGEFYGQMLTEMDQGGVDVVKAKAKYRAVHSNRTEINRPTVLWNPFYQFEYYGDVRGVGMNQSGDISKLKPGEIQTGEYIHKFKVVARWGPNVGTVSFTENAVICATRGFMPPWLVLMHELGHTKQYFEAGGDAGWTQRLQNVATIEADNLKDHENPICADFEMPPRQHYKHMKFGMDDVFGKYRGKSADALIISNTTKEREFSDSDLYWRAKLNAQTPLTEGFHFKP